MIIRGLWFSTECNSRMWQFLASMYIGPLREVIYFGGFFGGREGLFEARIRTDRTGSDGEMDWL